MMLFLPSTVTLFTGQHTFKDEARDCEDCHTVVNSEMAAGNAHESFECVMCHQSDYSAGQTDPWSDSGAHAAISVECLDCHSGAADSPWGNHGGGNIDCTVCHGDHSIVGDISEQIDDADEVHRPMIQDAATSTDIPLLGANEACIACHTDINVEVTLTYEAGTLYLNATEDVNGDWITIEWAAAA